MVSLELPIFDPVHEDLLRYRFDCWQGPIKVSTSHPLGQGICSFVKSTSEKRKTLFDDNTKTIQLLIPKLPYAHNDRYLYQYISLSDAHSLKMAFAESYYSEANRVINWGRRRGLNMKESIIRFIDMLDCFSGDYELHINYEQVRKMITRDDRKLVELMYNFNKRSVYKANM